MFRGLRILEEGPCLQAMGFFFFFCCKGNHKKRPYKGQCTKEIICFSKKRIISIKKHNYRNNLALGELF